MQPRVFQDYVWIIFLICLALFAGYNVFLSFLSRQLINFPYVVGIVQFFVFYHCWDRYQFISVYIKNGGEDARDFLAEVLSFLSYLFNAYALPLISMAVVIFIINYLNPNAQLSPTNNYLFNYSFLFVFNLIFILFFRHLAKYATKPPNEKTGVGESK